MYTSTSVSPVKKDAPAEPPRSAEIIPLYPPATIGDLAWRPHLLDGSSHVMVQTPFDAGDPALARGLVFMRGANAKADKWSRTEMTIGNMIGRLCLHEVGAKDGKALVFADIAGGGRAAAGVVAIYALGLDLDTNQDGEALDASIAQLGCTAVRYTTHSHRTVETRVPRDKVTEWATKHMPGAEIDHADRALLGAYLRATKGYPDEITSTAALTETEHTAAGIELVISHGPVEKHRVVFPLAAPYVIAEEGDTQRQAHDKWRRICLALADRLGVEIDATGGDSNRLFYLPRHRAGAPFATSLFGGGLLDWRELELGEEPAQPRTPKSSTDAGRALAKRLHKIGNGLQIAAVIRDHAPERIRRDAGLKLTIECPFDHLHSNAGDPADAACFACSAADGKSPIFTVSCRHHGCQGRTAYDMAAQMVADGWFDADVLFDAAYDVVDRGSRPASAPAPVEDDDGVVDAIADDIERLKRRDRKGRDAILDRIAALRREADREELLALLKKATGIALPTLRGEVRDRIIAARRAEHGGASAEIGVTLGDGHRVYTFCSEPDQVDATRFVASVLVAQNAAAPVWSQNMGAVMQMVRGPGGVRFQALSHDGFAARVAQRCSFGRVPEDDDGERQIVRQKPAREIVSNVYAAAEDYLPPQPELRRAPTVGAGGRLLDRDGRHGGIFVDLGGLEVPSIPENPTPEQVQAANAVLDEMLADFPFLDLLNGQYVARGPSLANAKAMLLTPFMRDCFAGPAPAFGVTKPTPGTGGSLLAALPGMLFDGAAATPLDYPDSEAEMQKLILSVAQSENTQMFFDDVKRFGGQVLLRSLTSATIGGRILGLSEWMTRDNKFQWTFTGNNPDVPEDMLRRVCWIRLNSLTADNSTRTYTHDLNTWVPQQRGKIIAAILTMVRAWAISPPDYKGETLASFDGWARAVGGVLQIAGVRGFLGNRPKPTMGRGSADITTLLDAWARRRGGVDVSESDLLDLAEQHAPSLAKGADVAQKMAAFGPVLDRLDGRTFSVGERTYIVQRDGDGWTLAPAPEARA